MCRRLTAGLRRWLGPAGLAACVAVGQAGAAGAEGGRSLVEDAFRAASHEHWERAFRLIAQADDPLAAKVLRWAAMTGRAPGFDFAAIAGFVLANPGWPMQEELRLAAEAALDQGTDPALARRFFEAQPPLTTAGRVRFAELLLAEGQAERALPWLRQAWIEGEFSPGEEAGFLARHGRRLATADHVARLDALLWRGKRASAERMLKRVPKDRQALAKARLRLQQHARGVDGAVNAVPTALQGDGGLVFDRLRWRREKDMQDGVLDLLLKPPANLGQPERWWPERELQIRAALREGETGLAYRLAAVHGQAGTDEFEEAEALAGWLALRVMERPEEALRRFVAVYEAAQPAVRQARPAYWAGRAAAALGDAAEAQRWYERAAQHYVNYYGQLAAFELGRPLPAPAPAPAPSAARRAAFEDQELVQVVRLLLDAKAERRARPFVLALAAAAEDAAGISLLAELLADAARPDLVALAGRYGAYYGRLDEAAAFPIPALDGLVRPPPGQPDPALLLAVARQESMFDSWGASHAGAQGLMQLIPPTATIVARDLGLPYNVGLLRGRPDYNIRLGSEYLRQMLLRFGDVPALALAAYNAGPLRVERWLETVGDPRRADRYALIDWIEQIPFAETRNYVQRVLEGRAIYERRLRAAEVALIDFPPINGPLAPLPTPALKPVVMAAAGKAAAIAPPPAPRAVAAIPARPRLKPGPAPAAVAAAEPPALVPAAAPPRPRPAAAPAAAPRVELVTPQAGQAEAAINVFSLDPRDLLRAPRLSRTPPL
jgi:soluble lytic murein transglycosylase